MDKETLIPIDDLGPSGAPGELLFVAIMANEHRSDEERISDKTPRPFQVFLSPNR